MEYIIQLTEMQPSEYWNRKEILVCITVLKTPLSCGRGFGR